MDWRGDELVRRSALWERLRVEGITIGAPRSTLRNIGLYAGQAGIFADANNRRRPDTGRGVAVTFVHTGASYADDLDATGLLYHYPKTQRRGAHDVNEVLAAKDAKALSLPVFVSSPSAVRPGSVDIHLGYLDDFDDTNRLMLITFVNEPIFDSSRSPEMPFSALAQLEELVSRQIRARPNQHRFKMAVSARYGLKCAVCDVAVPELLEAAHLNPKSQGGSDDARNGLQLCRNHHAALDLFLWKLEENAASISFALDWSPTLLGITRRDLTHLPHLPRGEAVRAFYSTTRAKKLLPRLYPQLPGAGLQRDKSNTV